MNLLRTSRAVALGIALVAAALSGAAQSSGVEIAVKERANAFASLAASGHLVALVWGAATKDSVTDIYLAMSRDGGRTFGAPTRVNQVPGDARLSGEQPPRVALVPRAGREPSIVVVWTSRAQAGTRLVSAHSTDAGRSFTTAAPLPGSEAAGNRGWESIATTRDGSVAALWLDHRELATGTATASPAMSGAHQHAAPGQEKADGAARAQLSKLFFANLSQPDSSRALTGGVCYCCKTTLATDAAGTIYAAWRHVYDGNIRDIAFTKSTDGGRTFTPPARVSEDNWVLDGCPENGPALAVDDSKRVHAVWPTLIPGATPTSEPTMALFYAMSLDGRRFTPRQRIPTEGFPRHPQVALGKRDEIVVAWDEQSGSTRRIAVARGSIDAKGAARFVRQAIGDARPAVYPVLVTVDDGTVVAWTSGASGETVLRADRLAN
jgi:hypothetical protein